MTARTLVEAGRMWRTMSALRAAGYSLMPLTSRCIPRDKGWSILSYDDFDCIEHLALGGAVGVRLGPTHLVVDIDPRNGGEDSFVSLCVGVGLRLDRAGVPKVRTGGGGMHLYYRKPASLRTRVTLPQYPGIDFKRAVGFVVAPGSLHARTGKMYDWAADSGAPADAQEAPETLLSLLEVGARPIARGDGGELTPEELAQLLAVLDPRNYGAGRYEDWIKISAAAHDATNGDGFAEWAEWCCSDPDYADVSEEQLQMTWDSFHAGKAGGTTYRTLFKAVSDAGRSDLLRVIEAKDALLEEDVYQVHPADDRGLQE